MKLRKVCYLAGLEENLLLLLLLSFLGHEFFNYFFKKLAQIVDLPFAKKVKKLLITYRTSILWK